MADTHLFSSHALRQVVEHQAEQLRVELDAMPDARLLNMDLAALQAYALEKYGIEFPVLGEPTVADSRTKMQVGRWGGRVRDGEPTVEVDAQEYRLEVPFTGDPALFHCQGATMSTIQPWGTVKAGQLTTTVVQRDPDAEQLNQTFERFLAEVAQHLGWLKDDVGRWNAAIPTQVADTVQYRRQKAEKAGSVAAALRFNMKPRSDRADTYAAAVTPRRKIAPQLPAVQKGGPPEPTLGEDAYRAILDTLKQMAMVMERSPHAYATLGEEALRFQFLVPLNANFEGEARAEVFNYGGKTDILITEQGRNVFIGECKFWTGPKGLTETVDQVLRYLGWRDTKCAILLFNRNRNFSQVLAQIRPTLEAHQQFVRFEGSDGETELTFTFRRSDDPDRRLTLTILAFDVPTAD